MARGTFRHGPASEAEAVFGGTPETTADAAPETVFGGTAKTAAEAAPETVFGGAPEAPAGAAPDTATGTMANPVTVHRLDGVKITTSAEAMEAIAGALDLPDHFGHNLDALYDVLTDLSWLPPGEHLLVWTEASTLRAADRPAYEAVRTVLSDAVADDTPGESFLSVLILTD